MAPKYECRVGRGRSQLNVKIKHENDRPMFTFRRQTWFPFPPIPENASEAICVKVGKLTNMNLAFMELIKQNKKVKNITAVKPLAEDLTPQTAVIDPDNPVVGLAVLQVPKQKFGKWECEINGGAREKINLTSGKVLLLKPRDRICFSSNKSDSWSKATSIDSTFIRVRAWDCSDNRSSGYHALNSSLMDAETSFSLKHVKLVAFKIGCDNVAGSNKTRDRCGQCPTRGVKEDGCLGCDGVPYSKRKEGKDNLVGGGGDGRGKGRGTK